MIVLSNIYGWKPCNTRASRKPPRPIFDFTS
nr:MAG TPA: hypothetical protein [Caudoviricetes sp.]